MLRVENSHIAIVGGGVAGLFSAFYLLKEGYQVTLFESGKCGAGCTTKAAGMLAPVNELEFTELELLHAGIASRDMYPEVEKDLGDIGLDRSGTIEVGIDSDDIPYLQRLYEFQKNQNLDVHWIKGSEIRDLEPSLGTRVQQAIWSPKDIQVDPILLVEKLKLFIQENGGIIRENTRVHEWTKSQGKYSLETDSGVEIFDAVVLAIGNGKVKNFLPYTIIPVRGGMMALETPDYPFLTKTVRIRSKVWGAAYIVPKKGRILLGSTSLEKGVEEKNTAGDLFEILRKSYAAVPGIYELDIIESWSGIRPSSMDRLPVIEQEQGEEVYHLNGMYRHGILLGPLGGKGIADLIRTGRCNEHAQRFSLKERSVKV